MYKYIAMDSEYCSMGRWISAIVGDAMNMKLYEGKDLIDLCTEEWMSEDYLNEFDERLSTMTLAQVKKSPKMQRVHQALTKAIYKAIEKGPCIIHERAAGEILKERDDCLKVLLYNTSLEHKIPRAIADKTYDLEELSHDEIIAFIKSRDHMRKVYRDAVAVTSWGEKTSYDLCLDSDMLGREKCAEILIEACQDISLDMKQCAQIIKDSFTWTV